MTTNTLRPLTLVNLLDPRLKCLEYSQEKLEYGLVKGASYSNYQQQKANSFSTSGVSFAFNTQGSNTIIDRRMYVKCEFQVSITGVPDNGTTLLNDNLSAPRAFPLASITENLSITINGTSISTQYADAMKALLRYNTNEELMSYDLSGTPTMLDNFQAYTDGIGSVRNPLAQYADSGSKTGRGSFVLDVVANPLGNGTDPRTAVVKFVVVEPLFISPMLYSSAELEAGLLGVNNMAVQLNFSNVSRVWSQALQGTENITNISVQMGSGITEIPSLLINYLNTPLVDEGKIPNEILYDYTDVDVFQNDQNTTLGAGQSQTFVNNSIQLSVVPRTIFIYCAEPRGGLNPLDTDSAFTINSVSLQYLNVSGQLSSATQSDLYNLCVKNGCKMSFQEWTGRTFSYVNDVPLTGSFLKLDVSDLAIPSNLSVGCPANSQLQFSVNITNQSNSPRPVSLYTIVCNEGLMTISNNTMMTQLAVVNQDDVLDTRMNGEYRDEGLHRSLYGGSFMGKLKHFGKRVGDFFKKTGLDKVAKDMVVKAVKSKMGAGMTGSGVVGGAMTGGRKLSRKELRELMEE
jgi:hypothetical protein